MNLLAPLFLSLAPLPQDAPPHVVFVVGEGEYRSEATMPALAERLEDTWGWRTTVLLDEQLHGGEGNHVPGLDALADADLVVLYLRFRQWPREDLDALAAYVERGGPLAAFRTTTHAFNYEEDDPLADWNDFGADVLGAPWIFHYGHGASTAASVVGRGQGDGILDGVPDDFEVRSWTYHVRPDYPPDDARVLVEGLPLLPDQDEELDDDAINPVAWTRRHSGGGRVFMTTMGHPEDFRVEAFRRLVGNGLHWALGRAIPDATLPDFPEVIHPDDEDEGRDGPWLRMDYGPFVSTAVGIGGGLPPVNKGIVVRLATRDGEETELMAVFDTDLVEWRCAWRGELALKGIVYDGPHGTFPNIEGEVLFRTEDEREHAYGPIDPAVRRWVGLHRVEDGLVFESEQAGERVLERAWAERDAQGEPTFVRETLDALPAPAAPRWGAPLVTRGIVDDALDEERSARRIEHPAGSDARTVRFGGWRAVEHVIEVRGTAALREPRGSDVAEVASDDRIGHWRADTGSGTHERNGWSGADDLRLDGVTWRRGVVGRSLDFDGTAAAWLDDVELDLDEDELTLGAWIHTTSDGTIFAVAPEEGPWAPDGVTAFLRGGRLSVDVGWVGVLTGGPRVDDGAWHHVAVTWRESGEDVRLFVDGERVLRGGVPLAGEEERLDYVPRFGWTNEDFPEVSRFSGYMDGLLLTRRAAPDDAIPGLAAWTGEPLAEATVVRWNGPPLDEPALRVEADANGEARYALDLPAVSADAALEVQARRGPTSVLEAWIADARTASIEARPFRIDRLTWPDDNPYGSWLRFGAFDFAGPESAWITTWSGDLWRVDGLDEDLDALTWTRVATGLNQPFGLVAKDGKALVLGRDQITRVHDANSDGEADFLESASNLQRNSEHFHEPASGLLEASDGSLYYIKAARHAKLGLHDHHGTVLRVSPDGAETEVVARGFRAPFGLALLPDGTLLGSDQEGHWTPANRINLIRPSAEAPRFYGNGWGARPDGKALEPWDDDAAWEPPLCWLHPSVDRSPSAQLHVDHPAWGPLDGALLGLSYGTGEVYVILRDGDQGGIVKLGIQLPTGLLAGRIHPDTGDLYVCGLFGWSSDRTDPGGFYRVRPFPDRWSETLNVPHAMATSERGVELTFLSPLDRATATDPASWSASAWNYRRTADYGSATYDLDGRRDARTTYRVRGVELSEDGRTARLDLEGFRASMQLHVTWELRDAAGRALEHEAHLTVHAP
ncbi:MAG: ThuA domain-containing protein [Planctomycetota bacterium]